MRIRTAGIRCKKCGQVINIGVNWFNRYAEDCLFRWLMIFHDVLKHKYREKFKVEDFLYLCGLMIETATKLIMGFVLGTIKVITFPFWWIHERI